MVKSMRSTKGASKARRDHINAEIRSLRALLPICEDEHERLSYLHSMSIICTFMRKCARFAGVRELSADVSLPQQDFLHALPGFIVAFTAEGKLLYVSENVSHVLGLSMVDVLQGDTFYDMIDTQDVERVKLILKEEPRAERSFVCRMVTSKAFRLQNGSCCSVVVRGRFQGGPADSALFVALCTPTVNRLRDMDSFKDTLCFQTLHKPDMSFAYAPYSIFFHLGFSAEELIGQSWYRLLHPDDLTFSAGLHKSLIQDDADVQMIVRLQCKDLSWVWICIWASIDVVKQVITCKNHIISETEAVYLREKLYSSVSVSSPQSVCSAVLPQGTWGPEPQLSPKRQSETKMDKPKKKSMTTSDHHYSVTNEDGRHSSPAFVDQPAFFCTPPYSPTSSHSSDFLSEGYDAADMLMACDRNFAFPPPRSPPDLSSQAFPLSSLSLEPHLYTGAPHDLHACAHQVPVFQPVPDVCEGPLESLLYPEDLDSFLLPQTHGRGDAYSREGGTALEGLLTPESSPTVDRRFQYSEVERDEISVLAHQICSLASSFDAYGTQMSVAPDSTICWPHTSSRPELLLDERVIDSILRDLDVVSVKENLVQGLSEGHSGALEPAVSTHDCREINSELHQLNQCLYGDNSEDGFTEESMY